MKFAAKKLYAKKFADLVKAIPEISSVPDALVNVEITGITSDSTKVKSGFVFVALKGEKTDGAKFIPQALQNGAAVVVQGAEVGGQDSGIAVRVDNPRLVLAKMAAAFYGRQPENIVAVTGTDGKTSTADFFRQFMFLADEKVASVGTIGIQGTGFRIQDSGATLTTPDSVELHRIFAELADGGVGYLAMEASSHGLSQYRLDGVKLKAAAFTNIARDHLDYHKTEEEYFRAKSRLFGELLPEGATAVLSQDDKRFPELVAICKKRSHRIIGFGRKGSEFTLESITPSGHGQHVKLNLFGKKYEVEIPLVGEFQVMNILAALGLVVGVGGDIEKTLANISKLKGVSGRLELVVTSKNGATVFIDFAHTPMALENILRTLRPHTKNKLSVVFGCGGDRDAGKRPLMGKAASELADFVIVTDDNPRSENPAAIRAAVLAGCADKESCVEVSDRRMAIKSAMEKLGAGDVLVIAGKGHEKVQIIGSEHLPFDDAQVAQEVASELGIKL
ncbi:MAG: UDP-N-acetylmuramoyl-L-alanyl-D-glutamate--2,6-diaminopimelate ligase [Pseudomonadota bacterium]